MQDEIVARLANTLRSNSSLLRPGDPSARQIPTPSTSISKAWHRITKGSDPEFLAQAREFFERALALDPGNLDALVGSAAVDTVVAVSYLVDDRSARLASAEAALARSLSLAPDHALAHEEIGRVQIYTNRAAQGIAECERALLLDRNVATAHATIGLGKLMAGRPEETEAHVSEALRLSPRDNRAFAWMQFVGAAKLHLGKDAEAIGWLGRSIEANRNHALSQFYLGAVLALLGRTPEARPAVEAGLAMNSDVHHFPLSRRRGERQRDLPRPAPTRL